jgi:SET domain-containing protein
MRRARRARPEDAPPYVVRRSRIHGRGVYATRPIPKGTRIVEYLGERITHEQADERYEDKPQEDGHTFLFVVDDDICIDAGVGGNEARFINHSCAPNCETLIENSRVFIEAIRRIGPGEELGYDYQLTWESTDDPQELALFACRCGAPQCRGTMLDPVPLDKKKAARRREAARKRKAAMRRKRKSARGKPASARARRRSRSRRA